MGHENTIVPSELPHLIVPLQNGKEAHYTILGSEISIGRDPSNSISISDDYVSKFHAKLLVSDQGFTLVDLGSANKTWVNDRRVTTMTVRYGDEIRFGDLKCRLEPPEVQQRVECDQEPPKAVPHTAHPADAQPAVPASGSIAKRTSTTPQKKRVSAPASPRSWNPMTRLIAIGVILISLSFVLALILRALLVPADESTDQGAEQKQIPPAAIAVVPAANEPGAPVDASIDSSPPGTPTALPSTTSDGKTEEQSAEYYFDEALSNLDIGRFKEAQANFRKVLELDPNNTRASTRLSLLEEELDNKAERHFNNGREAFNFLRYHEAIAEWEMFLTLADPSDNRYAEAQKGIEQAQAKLQ